VFVAVVVTTPKSPNCFNHRGEKSLSTGSIPHRLVVSPLLELPVGKGRRWLNQGGLRNGVLGGWQISTIATFQSGAPFGSSVLNGGRDYLGDSATSAILRPNLLRDPNVSDSVRGTPAVGTRGIQWADSAAFAIPAKYTYGNAARTLPGIYGPGLVNFSSMLGKNFRVAERWRLQFRWETLDTFNTPAFKNPATTLGSGNFGVVTTTTTDSRRIMQFGLKLYW
jgi:hypothetical protein